MVVNRKERAATEGSRFDNSRKRKESGLQIGAVEKSRHTYMRNTLRDNELSQADTATKGCLADGFHGIGYHNGCKVSTALKSIIFDDGKTTGDGDCTQTSAEAESIAADMRHSIRDNHREQIIAILKSRFADSSSPIGDDHGEQAGRVLESPIAYSRNGIGTPFKSNGRRYDHLAAVADCRRVDAGGMAI